MPLAGLRVDWPTFAGALGFVVIGFGFAGLGGYQTVTTWQFLNGATEVQARVAVNPANCDDTCTWWPTFKFDTPDGQTVSARTRHGSSDYGWPEGRQIAIHYNPAYPYVRPTGWADLWLFGGAFLGLGLIAAAVGLFLFGKMVFRWEDPTG